MVVPTPSDFDELIDRALEEDIGSGDVTTLATIPTSTQSSALMVARQPLVVSGLFMVAHIFHRISRDVVVEELAADGQHLEKGMPLIRLAGPAQALLSGERTALNFLQRLCGVATLTNKFVRQVEGTTARILDTRKTTPGWRMLEKYAVACGGGQNHRMGLYDMVLLKDNHLAALAGELPNPIAAAVQRARVAYPNLKVEVEADTLDQVGQAADAGADIILLDNMDPHTLKAAVALVAGRSKTEASGGVNVQTVQGIAQTGVDFISVGAITHSATAVDIGLDFE